MSENIIHEMKCPSCGGQVYFTEEGQEYAYCSHCGTQVFKEDTHFEQRVELEKHKVTENKNLAVEQMKHEEVKQAVTEKHETIYLVIGVVVVLVMLILAFVVN